MNTDLIEITTDRLSMDRVLEAIGHPVGVDAPAGEDPEAGALVTFSGIVRATEGKEQIEHLDYTHYPNMAEKELGKLIAEARRRWPLHRVALVHRVGPVKVAEASVIVAVSAGHRSEAFDAARFLIDELKKSVPIWKATPSSLD